MWIQSLGILLTLRCNAKCNHCCFEAGPSRKLTMAEDDAVRIVRDAAQCDIRGLIITGGEPFLEYGLLQAIINEAHKYHMASRIVTNAFWATSADRARALLEPLCLKGLRTLTISSDEMHEQYVSIDNVRAAIQTALEMGLRVIVASASACGHRRSLGALLARLELRPHPNLWLKTGLISLNGRAASKIEQAALDPLDLLTEINRLDAPCPFVVTEPVVTPDGSLAACCSPATATRTGFRRGFLVGNVTRTPFINVQRALESDPVFLTLMLKGPFALYRAAVEAGLAIDENTTINNQCDLCAAVLQNRRMITALRSHLNSELPALVAQALHIYALLDSELERYLEACAGVYQSTNLCCHTTTAHNRKSHHA